MEVSIRLPPSFNGTSLPSVVKDILDGAKGQKIDHLIFDFSSLQFALPCGIVFLSNVCHWFMQQGTTVSFRSMDISRPSIKFLDDSLFFLQHCGRKLDSSSNPRGTTQPLLTISQPRSHAWIESTLIPWLSNSTGVGIPSFYPIKACLSEIFNNIQDHTVYDIGSIFAQHFPNKKKIVISVADYGAGIPNVVRTKLPNKNDVQAIIRSVQQGFTTKNNPTNMGAGLSYLMDVICVAFNGIVIVYAGEAAVTFGRRSQRACPINARLAGLCPGTTFEIVLNTDSIPLESETEEELTW